MNKAKVLSLSAIFLLILQLFSPNLGLLAASQKAKSDDNSQVKLEMLDYNEETINWKLTLNAAGEENDGAKTKVSFSQGHSHSDITHSGNVQTVKTSAGYEVETPAGNETYELNLETKITNDEVATFSLQAETDYGGNISKAQDQVTIERTVPKEDASEREQVEPKKSEPENEKPEQEKPKPEQSKEEVKEPNNEKQQEDKKSFKEVLAALKKKPLEEFTEGEIKRLIEGLSEEELQKLGEELEISDEEYTPLEQYGKQTLQKAKAFSSNKLRMMQKQVDEATATHKIEKTTSDNICIREVDGTIDFTLPIPEEKQPVDIVIVQDASGSYAGNANQARQSLRDIVDMLDLSQDRMMVTSYRGYNGWNSYNNISNYHNGNVRSQKGINWNEQSLTLTNHTGLSNNADHLKTRIGQITFDGATPTAGGLQYAKEQYEAATAGQDLSDRKTVFILITDGVANAQLDGRIHIEHNGGGIFNPHSWAESYQFYQPTFAEVVTVANSIKSKGYDMVSAYWENVSILRNAYGSSYYNNTIGPAARQMVKDVASSPDYYSSNEDLAESISELLANLQNVLNEYDGFKTKFDITPGFELVEDSIYVNGSQANYSISGNTVTVTADKIKSGESTLTYKLTETAVHGNTTTPVTNGTISYDKENNTFKGSVQIPNANLAGNENSKRCETSIIKGVALNSSNDFTDNIELDEVNDSFTYRLEYQFDEKVNKYNQIKLKDELVSVLELIGTANDITVHSDNLANLSPQINVLNNQSGFVIDLPKQKDSYDYLAGKKITVTFQAKIRDGVTAEDLNVYPDHRIPNVAQLLFDGEPKVSEKVYVQPPKKGSITIIKVDADTNENLRDAEFKLKDTDGNVIETGVTNSNGALIFEDLAIGKYTLIETKAPMGYRLLIGEISVEITTGDLHVTETVENTVQGWEIPKTGGFGTLGFYGVGLILMAAAVWFVIKRRQT